MKKHVCLFFLLCLVFSSAVFSFELEDFVIKSRLFKSTPLDADEESDVVVSIYSVPVLIPYQPNYIQLEKINIHQIKSDLQKIYKIDRIDHLASGLMLWDGSASKLGGIVVVKESSYPLSFSPHLFEEGGVNIRIQVSPPGDPSGHPSAGRDLLDTEMVMRMDTPYVIGFPFQDNKYFLAISIARRKTGTFQKEAYSEASPDQDIPQIPSPVKKVIPVYPPHLKKDNIGGKVILQVTVDKSGNVTRVLVLNTAHPDLADAAKSAIDQWKFEPITKKNNPVTVTFPVLVEFKSNSGSADPILPQP